jgi:hypothetical protein
VFRCTSTDAVLREFRTNAVTAFFNTLSSVQWSEFLATDPKVPGPTIYVTRFPEKMDLERGPLSVLRINGELLERKSNGSGIENLD